MPNYITLNCEHNLNDIITKITSCFTLEILVIKELCLEMMNYHHDIMVMQPEISEIERKGSASQGIHVLANDTSTIAFSRRSDSVAKSESRTKNKE